MPTEQDIDKLMTERLKNAPPIMEMDSDITAPDLLSDEQRKKIEELAKARAELNRKIMEMRHTTFVRKNPKIGRNDPCPCGSGKKFKDCCMNADWNELVKKSDA